MASKAKDHILCHLALVSPASNIATGGGVEGSGLTLSTRKLMHKFRDTGSPRPFGQSKLFSIFHALITMWAMCLWKIAETI